MTERESSTRNKKPSKFSLDGLKEARDGRVNRLDQLVLDEDDNVYDLVDEDKYNKIVDGRRKELNFVVDDDGLGYYDDGEEILGVGEDAFDAKKRLKEMSRDGDNKAAKRARKIVDSTSSVGPKNSILRHMQSSVIGSNIIRNNNKNTNQSGSLIDIDSLLASEPEYTSSATHRGRNRLAYGNKISMNASRTTMLSPSRSFVPSSQRNFYPPQHQQQYHHTNEDDYKEVENPNQGGSDYEQPYVAAEDNYDEDNKLTNQPTNSTADTTSQSNDVYDKSQEKEMNNTTNTQSALELDRPKLSLSKANRKLKSSIPAISTTISSTASTSQNNASAMWGYKPELSGAVAAANNINSNIIEAFATDVNNSMLPSESISTSTAKIDPKSWLLYRKGESNKELSNVKNELNEDTTTTNDNNVGGGGDEEYVNIFWLDACENNGLIYLFGKLPVNDDDDGLKRYVSCCVVIHGSDRNLFVLPRKVGTGDTYKEDGQISRMTMGSVHQEISSILVPSIIPRSEGQSFRCKSVRRKYAFEYGEIPREETEYLKVVYSAKHNIPTLIQCQGGKTYERIFGAGSSILELFLLKRKLMGPCWITIRKPKANPSVVSWCKVEIAVDNPKNIMKTPSSECGLTPVLTSISISMKTAVNPCTHLHEIIMLSGVTHTNIDSEADSSLDSKYQRRFTFIRQLGLSCGSNYPNCYPHDLQRLAMDHKVAATLNERALLSLFFSRMQQEDPDIICSHNLLGFECDVLLARSLANKLPNWSLLGRLRKSKPPKSINEKDVACGRILCDTYKAAKEFLRETTYSLTYLAQSQLKAIRTEVDPMDVPKYFSSSQDILNLASVNMNDALLVQRLMLKLQVIPLTRQLTNLSGNLWSKTIRGARAERIEYLLLHEFHALKYILPEKKAFDSNNNKKNTSTTTRNHINMYEDDNGDMNNNNDYQGSNKVGGMSRKKGKASYAGGLVLEPKKGLYDTYILLLDFNSLYPSIIQEYNLCFTTIPWTVYMNDRNTTTSTEDAAAGKLLKDKKGKMIGDHTIDNDSENDISDKEDQMIVTTNAAAMKSLAPLPDSSKSPGVLPRVIKTLVDRRRAVKDLLKKEKDPLVKQQLDIRQKALKLTANSMYGCLGFSFSRFYARPIAELVTAMGREALQRTVDLATNQMSLDVIYGDTDSVMINTNLTDLKMVKEIGYMVKREVNKLYRSLELDLDGIFKSMLLLKKKKYAAIVINEGNDGKITYEKEMKGLDLVRRDWCGISKETGNFVVEQILSGNQREEIVLAIHDYLSTLASKIRNHEIPLEGFIITKGLNKHPKDYPDCNGQAHLQVALQMLKANKPFNIGDHIPYVICTQGPPGAHAAQRAYHPDEVMRSIIHHKNKQQLVLNNNTNTSTTNMDGSIVENIDTTTTTTSDGKDEKSINPSNILYTLDYEWYLSTQILPPISRLCEPIEGTSPAILSEKLGLDASKYTRNTGNSDELLEDGWGFTPKCQMDDLVRFQGCLQLTSICMACNATCTVNSATDIIEHGNGTGFNCTCGALYYGRKNASDCYCYLSNRVTLLVRACLRRYYECWLVCDDPSCGRRTMQQSIKGYACTDNCHGRMIQEYDESALHTQLKCLESLFDVARVQSRVARVQSREKTNDFAKLRKLVPIETIEILKLLHQHMANSVEGSAYNWIRPSLWSAIFGKNEISTNKNTTNTSSSSQLPNMITITTIK